MAEEAEDVVGLLGVIMTVAGVEVEEGDGNVEADGKEVVAAEVAALLGEASDVEPRLRLKLLIDMVYMH